MKNLPKELLQLFDQYPSHATQWYQADDVIKSVADECRILYNAEFHPDWKTSDWIPPLVYADLCESPGTWNKMCIDMICALFPSLNDENKNTIVEYAISML